MSKNKVVDLSGFDAVKKVELQHETSGSSLIIRFKNRRVLMIALDNDGVLAFDNPLAFREQEPSVHLGIDMGNGYVTEDEPYAFTSWDGAVREISQFQH